MDAWLEVEAFQEPGETKRMEVAVAFGFFAEQDRMIGAAARHLARLSTPLSTRVYIRLPVASAASAAIARAVAVRLIAAAIVAAGARDVNFAADNRLHAARGRFVVEMFGGKKIAVVRDGH